MRNEELVIGKALFLFVEELSKSLIWLTTPMQQRSKSRHILRLAKRHCWDCHGLKPSQ